MNELKTSFLPIIDDDSRVLILGSMPSEKSLNKNQYYGNEMNQFWRIIYTLFDSEMDGSYERRVAFIKKNRIALWDVLKTCTRKGSSDQSINDEEPNDLASLLNEYPNIDHVLFNGKKAGRAFDDLVQIGTDLSDRIRFTVLPSTSPAHAIPFSRKVDEWRVVRVAIGAIRS